MIRKIFAWLSAFFFPPRCPFCGELTGKVDVLCSDCRDNLPICHRYTQIPNAKRADLFCVRAPFYYANSPRRAVKALKFNNHQSAAVHFARAIADLEQVSGLRSADFVTAAPLSPKRIRQRGFNQSEQIARQYATIKGLPYLETLTKEDRPKQSLQISAKARAKNVKGSYHIIDPQSVRDKTIVLIDDVYTTGATLKECAKTLRKAGAACVIGLVGCSASKRKKQT